MLSKNQIKQLSSLHLKKKRDKERLFIAEGAKMVHELLHSGFKVNALYSLDEWAEKHAGPAAKKGVEIHIVSSAELEKISLLTTPQQVLAVVAMPEHEIELTTLMNKLTILLDDVKDPGNLGTIIRLADWFGIETIICSEPTVDVYNPKVVQATMGSISRVKVFYTNLDSFLRDNKHTLKLPVYAAMMKGESVYNAQLEHKGLILFGNESVGVEKGLLKFVDHPLTIPTFTSHPHPAESLNVAVAAAIFCSEFRRIGTDFMI